MHDLLLLPKLIHLFRILAFDDQALILNYQYFIIGYVPINQHSLMMAYFDLN